MDNDQKPKNDLDLELQEAIKKQLASYNTAKTPEMQNANSTPSVIASNTPPIQKNETEIEGLIKNVTINKQAETPDLGTIGTIPSQQAPLPKRPIIRTYKSDVEETMQVGHISSVNIAIAEQDRMRNKTVQSLSITKESKVNKNILILSLLLVLGGSLAFIIPYLLVQKKAEPAPVQVETVPSGAFFASDIEEKINLKDINLDRFALTLKERVDQSSTKLGQIKNIYFSEGEGVAEKTIDASRFISLLKTNAPNEILRTLKSDYMFGMHNYDGAQRFLVLRYGDYGIAFSGMLSWEINLWKNFKEVFDLKDTGFATSTATSTLYAEYKKFEDYTVENRDIRVIKNDNGKIVFLYSIVDEQRAIIISTSQYTLKEILNRIGKGKAVTQ